MKKAVIGYVFDGSTGKNGFDLEDKFFINSAKKKQIELVLFNLSKKLTIDDIIFNSQKCNVIYNNSIQGFSDEIIKTLETFGKKVIDNSNTHYYIQDKWVFYLKCRKYNVQVPKTILLSERRNLAIDELKDFNHWPVVLKRIDKTRGIGIVKADNILDAKKILKNSWKKEKFPIIAQEYIHSSSYRVTVINNKIVQAIIKQNHSWKCTGVYAKKIKKFKISKKLKESINKILKFVKIKVLGIDFLKNGDNWLALEVNSEPAFDFFNSHQKELVSKTLDFLKKEALKK